MEEIKKNENNSENKIINYIKSLNNIEKKALEIAKFQLESSFDIENSIGFIEWLKKNS
jgi:D-mannonate dehydratase